jgi:hypothetical protein
MRTLTFIAGLGTLMAFSAPSFAQKTASLPPGPPDFVAFARTATKKSLPLIQASGKQFKESIGGSCFSCHHQSLASMAVGVARERGFEVDTKLAQENKEFVAGFLGKTRELAKMAAKSEKAEKMLDTLMIDPAVVLGYGLAGLAADNWKPDAATDALTVYLMKKQAADGRFPCNAARPPMEGSEFTTTALSIKALMTYAPADHAAQRDTVISKARTWLQIARPKSTEDKVFRLYGLAWGTADKVAIQKAAADLLDDQRDDGGWGQLPSLPSDAYATGQAVCALNQAAGMPIRDGSYLQRGVLFLVASQEADGSWHVQKRAIAVQPHFDTGYPHDKSQFISMAGACWATMAVATFAQPEVKETKTVAAK